MVAENLFALKIKQDYFSIPALKGQKYTIGH